MVKLSHQLSRAPLWLLVPSIFSHFIRCTKEENPALLPPSGASIIFGQTVLDVEVPESQSNWSLEF